ncbi:c-type cytochrome [Xanthovirga aplysinae]|uniref:c-type cytochrome n=1 Tax=Xanthovirga aplysinae TaxID=2529853 RepID=UPI0012BD008C|nr:c-type cytochrome [Xanthovirga aplysinae]MTI32954.1 c-type cytochrome [Xanthovirga aplysinae]
MVEKNENQGKKDFRSIVRLGNASILLASLVLVISVLSIWLLLGGDQQYPFLKKEIEKPKLEPSEVISEEDYLKKFVLEEVPETPEGDQIRYGHALITETYRFLGPEVANPKMRYTGNNLACSNCHLNAGKKEFAAPFIGIWKRYPSFSNRKNRRITLKERINGCMERSMNGRKLEPDGKEMEAMVAYMKWLSSGIPDKQLRNQQAFIEIKLPERGANLVKGELLFKKHCSTCHGSQGQGVRKGVPGDTEGYVFPPLWGEDSYNHGAGMHRMLTAARFLKGNMPLGASDDRPLLTDEEAYDVAAFINSFDRPQKEGTEKDYPDLSKKPVDSPYPPFGDSFPVSQHKFGPFQPIVENQKRIKE